MPARRIVRDVNEAARDVARTLAKTQAFAQSRRDRKKVEMLFAHLKRILAWSIAPSWPQRRAVRVHPGRDRSKSEATSQACSSSPAGHINRVCCLTDIQSIAVGFRRVGPTVLHKLAQNGCGHSFSISPFPTSRLEPDFCNKIGPEPTWPDVR